MTPAPNRRLGIMAKRRPVSKRVCSGTTASSMPGVESGKGGSSGYRHQHPHSIDTLNTVSPPLQAQSVAFQQVATSLAVILVRVLKSPPFMPTDGAGIPRSARSLA
jgi:hypothetical protein